jgi:hypothetical protein
MMGAVNFLDIHFARQVERLHALGPRALAELLLKLGQHLRMSEIEALVAEFAAIDPEVLIAAGGDRMPPTPLHPVQP